MDPSVLRECWDARDAAFGGEVNFYHTGGFFPAISVTGSACALNCKHCRRIMIERLPAALDAESLYRKALLFRGNGAAGVLLTGGCDPDGKVPLEPFLDAVRKIKDETGMLLVAHTGIIGYDEAKSLREAGLDCVCLDVVGSVDTTREVYGLDICPRDYEKTLLALDKAGIGNIAPHVCVGLHNGELHHEKAALEIISSIKPANVVVIGLTNLEGTPMAGIRIKAEDVISVLCDARRMFPESYLSLGCARGKGGTRSEIDSVGIRAGVNNIAIPTPAARDAAERLGLKVNEYNGCCALLPGQLK